MSDSAQKRSYPYNMWGFEQPDSASGFPVHLSGVNATWLEAYTPIPPSGVSANPRIPKTGTDPTWSTGMLSPVPSRKGFQPSSEAGVRHRMCIEGVYALPRGTLDGDANASVPVLALPLHC